jgi:hypothetical protein
MATSAIPGSRNDKMILFVLWVIIVNVDIIRSVRNGRCRAAGRKGGLAGRGGTGLPLNGTGGTGLP